MSDETEDTEAPQPPQDERTAEQAPEPEADAAAEPPVDEAATEATPPEAAEPAADEPAEPAADEPAPEAAAPEAPAAAESSSAPAPDGSPGKSDEAPGANLEPILIESDRELSAEERARLEAEAEERARVEAEATAEGGDEPVARDAKLELPTDSRIQATGKRKTAIARVVLRPGGGAIEINRRKIEDYFPRSLHQTVARQALVTAGYESQVDVSVRVHGGGISGQADAVRHGIARALVEIDPDLRSELKRRGMLTRDARAKERRKAGLKKARKRPQFSKR